MSSAPKSALEQRMIRPEADIYNELFQNVLPIFQDFLKTVDSKETKVIVHKSPAEMKEIISYNLPEKSVLEMNANSADERNYDFLVDQIKKVLDYSCKVGNPMFMDKMYTGSEAIGVLGEAIRALLNTNIHVYSVCPVFAVLEVEIVRQLCTKFIGYPEDNHDGIMCPGGAFSNLLGTCCYNLLFLSY